MKTISDFRQEAKSYVRPNIYVRSWPKSFLMEYLGYCNADYCIKSGNKVDLFFDKEIKDVDYLFGQCSHPWSSVPYIDISFSFNEDVRNNDLLNFEEVSTIMSSYFHEQYHAHDYYCNYTLVPQQEQHYYQMSYLAAYGSNYDSNYTYEPFELKAVSSGFRGGMEALRRLGIPDYYVDYGMTSSANKYQVVRIHDAQTGFSDMCGYKLEDLYNFNVKNMTEFLGVIDYCYQNSILGRIQHNFSALSYKDYIRDNSDKSGYRFQQFLGDLLGLPVGLNGKIHSRFSGGWYNNIINEYAEAALKGYSFEADRIAAGIMLWYSPEARERLHRGKYPALHEFEFFDVYNKLNMAWNNGNESEASYFREYFLNEGNSNGKTTGVSNGKIEEVNESERQETKDNSVVSDYQAALSMAQEKAVDMGLSGGNSVEFDIGFER